MFEKLMLAYNRWRYGIKKYNLALHYKGITYVCAAHEFSCPPGDLEEIQRDVAGEEIANFLAAKGAFADGASAQLQYQWLPTSKQ